MSDEPQRPDEVDVDEAERPARWFRVPRKRRRWPWVFMWAALLVVGAGAGLAVASYQLLGTTLEKASPDTKLVLDAQAQVDPDETPAPPPDRDDDDLAAWDFIKG